MNFDRVRKVAEAVLYEGYILYPYRASAVKNRQRFNFGVLAPQAYCEATPTNESCLLRCECLVEGDAPRLDIGVRFLHLVLREVGRLRGEFAQANGIPPYEPVEVLEVNGQTYHTWEEAVEREIVLANLEVRALVDAPQAADFHFGPSEQAELLYDAAGQPAGVLVRRQERIEGRVTVEATSLGPGRWKVTLAVGNTTPWKGAALARERALRSSFVSAHAMLGVHDGQFVSLLDPPGDWGEAAAACQQQGAWPVLAGEERERDLLLCSPIILYDYPQIAPESQGDFFDAGEIDEMLALRVMTLTDEEKREMRSVDARARAILERTETLPEDQLLKLHGALRGLRSPAAAEE
jgi:hydrogenase maturation protease